jgi:hypothetical protein
VTSRIPNSHLDLRARRRRYRRRTGCQHISVPARIGRFARSPYEDRHSARKRIIGDLKLFEPITMLRLSRYATAKSAVVYGLQSGRVSASACSTGPPWGDGGPTPSRRLAPSGSAIAKSEASAVPSGGSVHGCNIPIGQRRAGRLLTASLLLPSQARIRVTDSWSFGRSRVTVFHTTSRSIST